MALATLYGLLCGVGIINIKLKEMKNVTMILTIITLSLTILACDRWRYYDYYVTNNCDEDIVITITGNKFHNDYPDNKLTTRIEPKKMRLVFSGDDYQPLYLPAAIYYIEDITVIKGNDTATVNFINVELWYMEVTAKDHANCYLTINPEDFENE